MSLNLCNRAFAVQACDVVQRDRRILKALAAEVGRRRRPTKLSAVRDELGPLLFAELETELAEETVVVRRGEIYAILPFTYRALLERMYARRQPPPTQLITSWWERLTRRTMA